MSTRRALPEKKNRPNDTAFQQQRLKAWQPLLTPRWVIGTFFCIGAIFVPVGIALYIQAQGVYEQVIVYDSNDVKDQLCPITVNNTGYRAIQAGNPIPCTLTFMVDRDLPVGVAPSVYYQLTNFYQNHRRYVKSRSDNQLAGTYVAPGTTLATACDPPASYQAPTGNVYYPCGLIATSFFNDRFRVNSSASTHSDTTMSETGIAWSVDMKSHFKNPTGEALNNWNTFQYLWQTYDQMSCISDTTGLVVPCTKWGQLVQGAYGTGCAKCPTGSTPRNDGGIPPPGGWQAFDPTSTTGDANAVGGLRDEHFVVWMRTAGLPTFRKLYGTITPPAGGFKKGDKISFEVVPNFEVQSFDGSKALVLSTSTPTGGKSNVMGVAYIVVGSVSLALAIAFFIKQLVAPRKLGDTKYIVWRQGTKTA